MDELFWMLFGNWQRRTRKPNEPHQFVFRNLRSLPNRTYARLKIALRCRSTLSARLEIRMRTVLTICAVLLAHAADAADLKSGLQVGDYPTAFNVADVTGPAAGQELCYRCRYTTQPVVSIFAREMNKNVTQLVKELDGVVGRNRGNRMAAFVVLLTDKPHDIQDGLLKVAEDNRIRNTPLTVYKNSLGPSRYRINKDADITVVMWVDSDVKANHAYKAEDLNKESIQKILNDTAKILN